MSEKHLSSQFDTDLTSISTKVLQMGGLVEAQIARAMRALANFDTDMCDQVLAVEQEINALEIEIDGDCNNIIARRQPTARDLRLVMAISKTITNLERAGDEAAKIAKRTKTSEACLRSMNGNKILVRYKSLTIPRDLCVYTRESIMFRGAPVRILDGEFDWLRAGDTWATVAARAATIGIVTTEESLAALNPSVVLSGVATAEQVGTKVSIRAPWAPIARSLAVAPEIVSVATMRWNSPFEAWRSTNGSAAHGVAGGDMSSCDQPFGAAINFMRRISPQAPPPTSRRCDSTDRVAVLRRSPRAATVRREGASAAPRVGGCSMESRGRTRCRIRMRASRSRDPRLRPGIRHKTRLQGFGQIWGLGQILQPTALRKTPQIAVFDRHHIGQSGGRRKRRGHGRVVVGELGLGHHLPPACRPVHSTECGSRHPITPRSHRCRCDVH